MVLRVTQSMMSSSVLRHISDGYGKLADLQDQLASGKKISRPSQDPVVATMGIAYRTDVNHIAQYQKNVTTAYKWLDSADDALQQVNDVLTRIRELTNEASTDTYTSDQRQDAAKEVEQLKEQLVTLGNTQVGGQYIFDGSNTDKPLLTIADDDTKTVTATANDPAYSDVEIAVNDGIQMTINVPPDSVFTVAADSDPETDDTDTLFGMIDGLIGTLNDDSSSGDQISAYLDKIDTQLDKIGNAQADIGAKTNRLDMIKNRLGEQNTIATKIMSNNEDADYAETIVDLNQQQNVYNAALSVGARIIQTSLVDFLQ
ncbi:MAG: flagellar hook-associated protein FlgL [Sporolactobacillus sp.]|nr:flagellar hook-associated protein FlgL [Sporolactobacillus sp.]